VKIQIAGVTGDGASMQEMMFVGQRFVPQWKETGLNFFREICPEPQRQTDSPWRPAPMAVKIPQRTSPAVWIEVVIQRIVAQLLTCSRPCLCWQHIQRDEVTRQSRPVVADEEKRHDITLYIEPLQLV